jgi:hypothetical protein
MDGQLALELPLAQEEGVVVINGHCQIRALGEHRVVVVAGLPTHHYATGDAVAEAYAMVSLVDSGFALQREVAQAFGCCERTVRRNQRRYAEGGMAALAGRSGWRPGRRRIPAGRLRMIERFKAEGMSNRAIAGRMGVTEAAIRKLVDPEKLPHQEVLPFPEPEQVRGEEKMTLTSTVSSQPERTGVEPEGGSEEDLASEVEPVPMSLDVDPGDRCFDRLMACFGLLDDAAPLFASSTKVPGAGVLFAVPMLVCSGIFSIARRLYGEIGPSFYGLRTTLLTLLLMALLRVKRAEGLKERDPAAFGRLLGLDRAPEMKTLRHKLSRLAARHRAEQLGTELARRRIEQRGQAMGFLYIDGHVRVYHGKHSLPKTHVTRMRISSPATTDYWINDQTGDPVLVITAEANAGLVKTLPNITAEIRSLVGQRRVTIVFDRGGWSPKLFLELLSDGFDILTYRKGRCPPIETSCFVQRTAVLDGRKVRYCLNDDEIDLLKGELRLRQVTRLCDDGHQTQIVTSLWRLSDVEIAHRMFDRWRQENFFKYMREEFLLDALVDYHVEPDDPTRTVPNPERRALDAKIRAARAEVAKLEQDYGAAALDNPESKRRTMRGFKIAHGKIGRQLRAARKRLELLVADRLALPARVEIRDISLKEVVKLATERKHLTDILKMLAYQAESDLLRLLHPHYARVDHEGRTLLHELFAASGSIEVTDHELRITLLPLSSPHRSLAAQALAKTLNDTATLFPGTRLRLCLAVQSMPARTMAFPGPRDRSPSNSGPGPDISASE